MTDQTNDLNEQLSAMFSAIDKQYAAAKDRENKRRAKGELFNIFNIIKLRTEEVRLHSALLAELLYPKGHHGVSSLFLKAFLRVIDEDEEFINCHHCSSNIKERYIGVKTKTEGGRIDIIIEDGNHAIIIENKIYAPDQDNQLLRYYNYGKTKFPNGFKLIYLTLHGSDPSCGSLGNKKFDYQTISYDNEIINWLEQCSELAKDKDNARIIINQYRDLVKKLTAKDMDEKYIAQLKEITLAPNNVKAVGEILKMQDVWISEIQEKYIWQPLRDYAESNAMKYGEDDNSFWIYKQEWQYYGIIIDYDKGWYIGISWYNNPNRTNRIHIKHQKKLSSLKEKPMPDWPYGWEYFDICDWSYSNTDKIVDGHIFEEIKTKIEDLLTDIESQNLRIP